MDVLRRTFLTKKWRLLLKKRTAAKKPEEFKLGFGRCSRISLYGFYGGGATEP